MQDNLVENYFSIIEQLLDDALGASAGSDSSITSAGVQSQLSETLGNMQADMEKGLITITPEDKTRLISIMEKLSTLESNTHAHLGWFNDLAKRLQHDDDI
jgi:hypothetical protein